MREWILDIISLASSVAFIFAIPFGFWLGWSADGGFVKWYLFILSGIMLIASPVHFFNIYLITSTMIDKAKK